MKRVNWQFLRFLAAAGLSLPFNLLGRVLLSTVTSFGIAVAGAQVIGMVVAFATMKYFVFARSGRSAGSEFARFALVNSITLLQAWALSLGALSIIPNGIVSLRIREFIAHVFGLSTTAVTAFIFHRYFSFQPSRNRAS